jgi:hypothetical protein
VTSGTELTPISLLDCYYCVAYSTPKCRRNDAQNDAGVKHDLRQGRHRESALPVAGGKTLCHRLPRESILVNRCNWTLRRHLQLSVSYPCLRKQKSRLWVGGAARRREARAHFRTCTPKEHGTGQSVASFRVRIATGSRNGCSPGAVGLARVTRRCEASRASTGARPNQTINCMFAALAVWCFACRTMLVHYAAIGRNLS